MKVKIMKNNLYYAVGIIVFVMIAVAAFFLFNKPKVLPPTHNTPITTNSERLCAPNEDTQDGCVCGTNLLNGTLCVDKKG